MKQRIEGVRARLKAARAACLDARTIPCRDAIDAADAELVAVIADLDAEDAALAEIVGDMVDA